MYGLLKNIHPNKTLAKQPFSTLGNYLVNDENVQYLIKHFQAGLMLIFCKIF